MLNRVVWLSRDWLITRTRADYKLAEDLGEARKSHRDRIYDDKTESGVTWWVRVPSLPLGSPPVPLLPFLPFSFLTLSLLSQRTGRLCSRQGCVPCDHAQSHVVYMQSKCKVVRACLCFQHALARLQRACMRAFIRTFVRASATCWARIQDGWRARARNDVSRLGKNCRRFDEKLGYLTETKLGLEVSRSIGCASPTASDFASDSKIVGRGPRNRKLSLHFRKWLDLKFPRARFSPVKWNDS